MRPKLCNWRADRLIRPAEDIRLFDVEKFPVKLGKLFNRSDPNRRLCPQVVAVTGVDQGESLEIIAIKWRKFSTDFNVLYTIR
jgi:hypothetical protein